MAAGCGSSRPLAGGRSRRRPADPHVHAGRSAGYAGGGCSSRLHGHQSASDKDGAEANYKGYGFFPLTAWCSNTGESLAVQQRPGSAGSFTAADHIKVADAALAQVPVSHRSDLLVTTDGAGASRALIEHLTTLNTVVAHRRRGRRVEYSIGWALDARTVAAIGELPEGNWDPG